MLTAIYDTKAPADSVECLRITNNDDILFSIGTYLYDSATSHRSGSLSICKWNDSGFTLVDRCASLPGVLDCKWITDASSSYGIVALADGNVARVSFDGNQQKLSVDPQTIQLDQGLVMAVDLNHSLQVASSSSGGVFSIKDDKTIKLGQMDMEAWTISIDQHQNDFVHAGDDSGLWRCFDSRQSTSISSNRWHSAGVCSIQSHPTNETLLVTGSYDQRCALWDRRSSERPLTHITVNSGVWRLQWRPVQNSFHLLAACMYDGFHIFEMNQSKDQLSIKTSCAIEPFNALAYGACWATCDRPLTCSFYNHQVQLWNTMDFT